MKSRIIQGATRVLSAPGCEDLHIRDYRFRVHPMAIETVPAMASVWMPDADELKRLADGAPIVLHILGQDHPPVMLTIDKPPPKIIVPRMR